MSERMTSERRAWFQRHFPQSLNEAVSWLREALTEAERAATREAALETALRDLLASADCSWEGRNLGHDWRDACEAARAALTDSGGTSGPRCRYCKEPVERDGEVHAGGCGNFG